MNTDSLALAAVSESLNSKAYAMVPRVLSADECMALIDGYNMEALYRNTINMKRYRFGEGEYKYFSYPLPNIVETLRTSFYPTLAKIANTWMKALHMENVYPETHQQFIGDCHSKNQHRPTPLILKYAAGGFNTLHQDLYGEIFFPFQMIIALTQEGVDYEGGALVLTEQVPRAQSKASVVKLNQGDAAIITTNFRPVQGSRGYYRASMKHGVSEVTAGVRYALGIIFHDAA